MNSIINSADEPLSSAPHDASDVALASPEARFRSALALAIKRSPMSRAQIAEAMTLLLRRPETNPITIHIVNSWTSETKDRVRLPAAWIPAFCAAAMDDTVLPAFLFPDHRARLELTRDLEALRREITALLAAERERARAKNNGAARSGHAKQGKEKR